MKYLVQIYKDHGARAVIFEIELLDTVNAAAIFRAVVEEAGR